MKIKKLITLAAMTVMTGSVWGQTDNLLQGWDGTGCETTNPKPSDFGWSSSESRTLNAENANSGIRFTTTYDKYKLSDGTSYTYSAGSNPSSKIFRLVQMKYISHENQMLRLSHARTRED